MSLDDVVYLVRLVEMSLDAIVITESNRINWPKSLKGIEVPPVDGVLALYDVTNQQSINGIPDLLRWSPPLFLFRPLLFCQLSPSSCKVPPAESYTPYVSCLSHASQHYTANKLSS